MEALHWIWTAGAAIVGALIGAVACHWVLGRTIAQLQNRLMRSEQARVGAVERSAQAREQIAQLNRAITELRKAHTTRRSPDDERRERAAQAEEALKRAADDDGASARREPLQAFADTEPWSAPGTR
jgi:hypothetical protein